MDFNLDFQPCQIVFLEHQAIRVYAEVIQVVEQRQVCWVRPLALQSLPASPSLGLENSVLELYDLRQGVDLLFPTRFFQAAIDTEVMPLLTQLYALETSLEELRLAQKKLRQFVRDLGQSDRLIQQV